MPLGTLLVLHWSVERRIAALQAAGQPVTLADLKPLPLPDDQNAAVLLDQIAPELEATYDQLRAIEDLRDVTPCDFGLVAHIVDGHPDLFDKLRQVAERPDCRFEVSFEGGPMPLLEFDNWIRFRQVAVLARNSAAVKLLRGNSDDAACEALCAFHVSRHTTSIPLFIHFMVHISIQSIALDIANLAIQRGRVSPELLSQLDREARLACEEEGELYTRILAGERAWALDYFKEQTPSWYLLPLQPVNASLYLRGMEREVQSAKDGQPGPPEETADLSWLPTAISNELSGASAAAAGRVARLHGIARLRCFRVLIALARREGGGDPERTRIEELGLGAEELRDPFSPTGAPLKLSRKDGAWVIYSIGQNQFDDGGSLDYLDLGIGPPELP